MKNQQFLQFLTDLHLKTKKLMVLKSSIGLKTRLMSYMHLDIKSTKSHTQVLCSGQNLLNSVLQSRLKKSLGFSTSSARVKKCWDAG